MASTEQEEEEACRLLELEISKLQKEVEEKKAVVESSTSSPGKRKKFVQPPTFPFTVSPLPGTTLGVIRAPLDPHGHTHLGANSYTKTTPKKGGERGYSIHTIIRPHWHPNTHPTTTHQHAHTI